MQYNTHTSNCGWP